MIQKVYNKTIRPYLPRRYDYYNGVFAFEKRILDRYSVYNYKNNMKKLIKNYVNRNDTVLNIATGRGIFPIWAARKGANIITYEGSEVYYNIAERTFKENPFDGSIDSRKGIVGKPIDVWEGAFNIFVDPKELPYHTVMILDCEDSEVDILKNSGYLPQVMMIEVHNTREKVERALESSNNNYDMEYYSLEPHGEGVILAIC